MDHGGSPDFFLSQVSTDIFTESSEYDKHGQEIEISKKQKRVRHWGTPTFHDYWDLGIRTVTADFSIDAKNEPFSEKEEVKRIVISTEDRANGTGSSVWDGAVVLVRYLQINLHRRNDMNDDNAFVESQDQQHPWILKSTDSPQEQQKQQQQQQQLVMELGSGTGYVGLCAAALGASHVLMTDLPECLPLIDKNIDQNIETIRHMACTTKKNFPLLQTEALPWGNEEALERVLSDYCSPQQSKLTDAPIDLLVLISDCVVPYDPTTFPLLSATIAQLLQRTGLTIFRKDKTISLGQVRVLMAYEVRAGTEEFFDVARSKSYNLVFHSIPYDSLHPEYRDPDIQVFEITLP